MGRSPLARAFIPAGRSARWRRSARFSGNASFAAIGAPDACVRPSAAGYRSRDFRRPGGFREDHDGFVVRCPESAKRICRARFLIPFLNVIHRARESLVHYKRAKVSVEQIAQGIAAGTDVFWLGDISQKPYFPCSARRASSRDRMHDRRERRQVLDHLFAGQTSANEALCRTLFASNLKAIVSQELISLPRMARASAARKSCSITRASLPVYAAGSRCIPSLIQAGAPEE